MQSLVLGVQNSNFWHMILCREHHTKTDFSRQNFIYWIGPQDHSRRWRGTWAPTTRVDTLTASAKCQREASATSQRNASNKILSILSGISSGFSTKRTRRLDWGRNWELFRRRRGHFLRVRCGEQIKYCPKMKREGAQITAMAPLLTASACRQVLSLVNMFSHLGEELILKTWRFDVFNVFLFPRWDAKCSAQVWGSCATVQVVSSNAK